MARLVDALAQRAPLVLLLDDLQWVDGASLDLLRYLGRHWKGHGSRVLLLGTVRSEELELNPQLSAQLSDLGRDLPLTPGAVADAEPGARPSSSFRPSSGERTRSHGPARPSPATSGAIACHRRRPLVALGDFLFAQTGGQPLYLLETLKLLRERQWLVPRLVRMEPGGWSRRWRWPRPSRRSESRRALLPPSVRAMILARLAKLRLPHANW